VLQADVFAKSVIISNSLEIFQDLRRTRVTVNEQSG
jgi:hypothetical protein